MVRKSNFVTVSIDNLISTVSQNELTKIIPLSLVTLNARNELSKHL